MQSCAIVIVKLNILEVKIEQVDNEFLIFFKDIEGYGKSIRNRL